MKALSISFSNLVIVTIGIVSIIFFLSFKWVNNQWHYNIASDGKGYYVYLPAAFIYHDFSFKFTEQTEAKNYVGDVQPSVATLANGQKLNKYFVGEALLLLPFFFVACLISYFLGFPIDGYSFVFQASVSVAAVFYAILGLWQLKRLLVYVNVSDSLIGFIILLVFGGSTVLHYTWMEPSMSHVYSFFALTAFIATAADFIILKKSKYLLLLFLLLGIICLIRPVNVLIVLFLPFLLLLLGRKFSWTFFSDKKRILIGLIIFIAMICIQFLMYRLQVGRWWVWAYAREGFNFFDAHFFEFLFSFRKGWIIYSPIVLISFLTALFYWRKNSLLMMAFFAPFIVIIYVASSWHDWAYGASFGSRPMTEFISIVIIPMAIALSRINNYKTKALMVFAAWCFLLLNGIQTYQINKHILLWDNMTFETYKASFLKTHERFVHMLD
jgi:hypothetical protein